MQAQGNSNPASSKGRVVLGDCPPRAPTVPDVQITRDLAPHLSCRRSLVRHQRGRKVELARTPPPNWRALYDALEVDDSAVKVLGDETLPTIARELVDAVRKNDTIDWAVKESARAKMRTIVRRLLRKYGYPPDKQEKATQTVIEQAELLCRDWAA